MTYRVICFCGNSANTKEEAEQSGFLPVLDFNSSLRWYCPGHAPPLIAAARALLKHCGPNATGMLPPWLIKTAQTVEPQS